MGIITVVWIAIYVCGGIITETRAFADKESALLYFDHVAKDYDVERDLEEYVRDVKTGYCRLYDPNGGRHPVEVQIEKKPIELLHTITVNK